MPPMVCFGYAGTDGMVTARNLKHYEERARGGPGLIIIEATCVNPQGRLSDVQLGLWSDDQIEGFRKIADICHRYGAVVMLQIHHAGMAVHKNVTQDKLAPSDFQGVSNLGGMALKARAMTLDEIHQVQSDFVSTALRAQKAGLDGVELHGAHGYLISQFLSPLANRRTDAYGGSLIKRTRFATEIISKIRQTAGPDFIIGCRMGCDEPDLKSSIRIAKRLEQTRIDLLHVSLGMSSFVKTENYAEPSIPEDFGYNWIVYGGTVIKKNVSVPVIVVNGIRTPRQAGYLIENGLADFAAIGKGLLVNPNWAIQAQKGQEAVTCLDCKRCAFFNPGTQCPAQHGTIKATV